MFAVTISSENMFIRHLWLRAVKEYGRPQNEIYIIL